MENLLSEIFNNSSIIEIIFIIAGFIYIRSYFNNKLEKVETSLRAEIKDTRKELSARMDKIDSRIDRIESRMDKIGNRIDNLYQLFVNYFSRREAA